MSENTIELLVIVFWVILTVGIVIISFYIYRRIMYPLPKRDSIIKKKYFMRNRYIIKEFMRIFDNSKIKLLDEYLEAFNFIPLNDSHDLWIYTDEWGEIYVHLTYENEILQVKIFTLNPFAMARASSIVDNILDLDEGIMH